LRCSLAALFVDCSRWVSPWVWIWPGQQSKRKGVVVPKAVHNRHGLRRGKSCPPDKAKAKAERFLRLLLLFIKSRFMGPRSQKYLWVECPNTGLWPRRVCSSGPNSYVEIFATEATRT
jgi:hypothetical protein